MRFLFFFFLPVIVVAVYLVRTVLLQTTKGLSFKSVVKTPKRFGWITSLYYSEQTAGKVLPSVNIKPRFSTIFFLSLLSWGYFSHD